MKESGIVNINVKKSIVRLIVACDIIITDRVRSTREDYVLTRVCPSIHPSVCLSTPGGYPSQVQTGGYPSQVQVGGTPARCWGVPHLGYPLSDLAGGILCQGVPHLGYPPQPGPTVPVGAPRLTDGVLDTPWSVCLLRSHRRTFLLFHYFSPTTGSLLIHDVLPRGNKTKYFLL